MWNHVAFLAGAAFAESEPPPSTPADAPAESPPLPDLSAATPAPTIDKR